MDICTFNKHYLKTLVENLTKEPKKTKTKKKTNTFIGDLLNVDAFDHINTFLDDLASISIHSPTRFLYLPEFFKTVKNLLTI